MMKILKSYGVSPAADEIFKGCEYSGNVQNPDGIMIGAPKHGFPLGANLLVCAYVGASAVSCPEEYSARGIALLSAEDAAVNAVKEAILCELLLAAGNLIDKAEHGKTGRELLGKRLGIAGMNAVGAAVANAAFALGMRVSFYDPSPETDALLLDSRAERTDAFSDLLLSCDFLSLHLPLTPQTRGILNKKSLAACKKGIVIINHAHGELSDAESLSEATKNGTVAYYITDLPCEASEENKRIVMIPRLAAKTEEAENERTYTVGKRLLDYLMNGNLSGCVNFPSLSMPRAGAARLCILHKNKREILSKILGIVTSQAINAVQMQAGNQGDYGYLLLDLDQSPAPPCLELIENIAGVIRLRRL